MEGTNVDGNDAAEAGDNATPPPALTGTGAWRQALQACLPLQLYYLSTRATASATTSTASHPLMLLKSVTRIKRGAGETRPAGNA